MQSSRWSPAWPQKPFDTSGKSPAHIHHPPILRNALWPIRPALSGAIALACARRTIARALIANARARGDIDVNAIPDLNKAAAIAATAQTRAAAALRLILPSRGYSIDHPDPELGGRLMADALGVAHRSQFPLFPQQQTFRDAALMSASCQQQTDALRQKAIYSITSSA
jgi:hypothetical protein